MMNLIISVLFIVAVGIVIYRAVITKPTRKKTRAEKIGELGEARVNQLLKCLEKEYTLYNELPEYGENGGVAQKACAF